MSGEGTFNNSSKLSLNHAASVLKLDGIGKIERVSVTENLSEGFIDVDKNAIIKTLSHPKSSKMISGLYHCCPQTWLSFLRNRRK